MSAKTNVTRRVYHVDGGPSGATISSNIGILHSKKVRRILESLQQSKEYSQSKLSLKHRRKLGHI